MWIVAAAAWALAPGALAGEPDLQAAFARAFPGYEVLTMEDFTPEIVQAFQDRPGRLPAGHTPAWAPGDYDGDGVMDVAVLAKRPSGGKACADGLFAIITTAGRKLHESDANCPPSPDVIMYHPPGHTIQYMTDRYDMPDATEEEMFAKTIIPYASVEHITWEVAAGLYSWNPRSRQMETFSTAD